MVNHINLDKQKEYKILKKQKEADLRKILNPKRVKEYNIKISEKLNYNYSCKAVTDKTINILQKIANKQQAIEKYKNLLNGEFVNTGENRMVMHQMTRGKCQKSVEYKNQNLEEFYKTQKENFFEFSKKVHSGDIKGSTGKKFKKVVQIGIGGSDLGPRALYLALKNYAINIDTLKMEAEFISNVDPDDANSVLQNIDYETTLFILVSKSGTTQETLTNQAFVIEKMLASKIENLEPKKHMVAVTSETSPLAKSEDFLDSFYIDDFIGGRYSSTSAVGGVVLSLAFGEKVFQEILNGAHQADKMALEPDIKKNAALMDALIGIYERECGHKSTAVLPYSQALIRFPAHLQQLDMESNGKSVNRFGEKIKYKTGPIILGEPGTNGQHSFYQLLHQGTDIIPLQFIGFKNPQIDQDIKTFESTSQEKLKANLIAQIVAFAQGSPNQNANKNFSGNRYSSLIYADDLIPENLGSLLAHYENKVMFQGFIWNLNSFDQEGVQLGKKLANEILSGDASPVAQEFCRLLF